MRKILIPFFTLLLLNSCKNNVFKVEGIINNAQGEVIVLEHTGIAKTTVLDSVKISRDGKYSLKGPQPEYPDFYRLRIKNKSVTFTADSTETIVIHSNFDNFSTEYTVENSYSSGEIKKLRISLINLQNKVNSLRAEISPEDRAQLLSEIETELENHKVMARELIMANPRSATAYFALYQQINGDYIFSPFVTEDYPYWAAVATAYHTFMPDYKRSKNLYAYVLEALKEKQMEKQQAAINELMETAATGYIDIALPDKDGVERKLSDLEGKVVLIDFNTYEAQEAIDYTFALRDLYSRYQNKGFEIYQVCLDRNRILWDISIENIPWICVRDENGPDNRFVQLYNVTKLPTSYLMDKEGTIVARDLKFTDMDKEIDKLLKKK